MCSSETLGTIPTSLLVFVEKFLNSLIFLLSMECKLHSGNLSPEALVSKTKTGQLSKSHAVCTESKGSGSS